MDPDPEMEKHSTSLFFHFRIQVHFRFNSGQLPGLSGRLPGFQGNLPRHKLPLPATETALKGPGKERGDFDGKPTL